GVHYPIPLHLQPAYSHLGYREGEFPAAERAAREVLSLPMCPELAENELEKVVEVISHLQEERVASASRQGVSRMII
ncbi:MAG: DegT/DnrJ/EryC1/StrS family aminotransferase, partial [Dehalococcoidia bacterium]|nr:DegT/DnrJ/EryC1/StrS family aminotransferase [Dehalococcoidia bacterium]